jgi:hypothetical protein
MWWKRTTEIEGVSCSQTQEDVERPMHLQSWRGNCDVQVLLYKKPGELDIAEAQVVDYIIAYSCKGQCSLKEELAKTRNLSQMHSTELTGCKGMYTECAGRFNKAASSRLISKQEAGHAGVLTLYVLY